MKQLGIDFGTTKTLATRWDERTQSARTIRLGRGSDAIPTTLYCDDKGEFQFGDDADDMRALDAAGWKGRIKRDLGKGASVVLHGKSYKVVHLISRFLGYVRERVEKEVFHGKIDHTVITVPALYGPSERSELIAAAKKAGFKSVELVDEPVAAGRAFLHDKAGTELGDQVLVFDWGGGTLDLALVERRDGAFHLNHDWIGGEKYLGGEDIDDAMVEEADRRYAESHGRIDEQEDERQTQIRRNLKEGKELLSRKTNHKFRLLYKRPQEFSWSRAEFEEFTASITDQAIDCLSKQVQKIRAKGVKPQQVLLVGGSSNMPVVKRRIEDELGLKALFWENSQTAVALGAATIGPAMEETLTSHGEEPYEVECPHCDEVVEVPGDGEYECPHCVENFVVGNGNTEENNSIEVECPHCSELVEVPCDGKYECPHCGENLVVGMGKTEKPRRTKKRSSQRLKKQSKVPNKFKRETITNRTPQTQLTPPSTTKNSRNPYLEDALVFLERSGPLLLDAAKKMFGF